MVFTRAHGDKGIDESLHTWSIIALRSPITVFTLNADLKTASGLNARKLRPAWLTADLALLDANIASHTWLIYLHLNERREATTYIKYVFTFDRFQAVTVTKWERRAGGEDMHLWLLLGRHHGADSHSILLSLSQCMLLFKDMCVVLMASWLLPQSRVRNVKSTVSRMRP